MFVISFQTAFLASLEILLMGAVGYFLARRKIMGDDGLRLLTTLVVNILWPCFIFYRLVSNFSFERFPWWWAFPLVSLTMTTVAYIVGKMISLLNPRCASKEEFVSLVMFQNAGFIPLLLIGALFTGEQQQQLFIYTFLFILGFDSTLWSLAVWRLTRHKTKKMEWKKVLNPPLMTIAVTLGLIYVGLQRFVPQFVLKPAAMFGDAALPLAMLVVGGNLCHTSFQSVKKRDVAFLVLAKLIIFPAVVLMLVRHFHPGFLIGFFIVLESTTPSAVTLSVIGKYYKVENAFINQGIFFSHIASVVTVPFFLTMYTKLGGF